MATEPPLAFKLVTAGPVVPMAPLIRRGVKVTLTAPVRVLP